VVDRVGRTARCQMTHNCAGIRHPAHAHPAAVTHMQRRAVQQHPAAKVVLGTGMLVMGGRRGVPGSISHGSSGSLHGLHQGTTSKGLRGSQARGALCDLVSTSMCRAGAHDWVDTGRRVCPLHPPPPAFSPAPTPAAAKFVPPLLLLMVAVAAGCADRWTPRSWGGWVWCRWQH
jgi:hypothetical protein